MLKINRAEILATFKQQFPQASELIMVRAPGRVNLIGEHTDYNDGFVLPMAIDAEIIFVGSIREDSEVHVYSRDFQTKSVFDLENFSKSQQATWSNYIRGVCAKFLEFTQLKGMNIVLQGNVPQGAGLSSSAALEIGVAVLIRKLNQLDTSDVDLVKLAQKAENEFVGVNCGIMDQFISMLGKKDHVLFLDCRSLEYKLVPAPFAAHDTSVVVINSGVKRGLVDSEYNLRRNQCDAALNSLKKDLPDIKALRDVDISHLDLIEKLEPVLKKRARHVVTENQRVLDTVKLLTAGDISGFGNLMNQSHVSLRDDYEVSCPELDLLVSLAQSVPGTYGSRMTGAGFGGSTVSLVKNSSLANFKSTIEAEYTKKTTYIPEIFVFNPSEGAEIL